MRKKEQREVDVVYCDGCGVEQDMGPHTICVHCLRDFCSQCYETKGQFHHGGGYWLEESVGWYCSQCYTPLSLGVITDPAFVLFNQLLLLKEEKQQHERRFEEQCTPLRAELHRILTERGLED